MSETYLPSGLPQPVPERDGLDAGFWEAARQHRLVVQRCRSCGTFQTLPEWLCHRCHAKELEWAEVSGRGRIYSWMRAFHAAHPALAPAVPYRAVVVELPQAGGVRLVGNLLGPAADEVTIGAEVEPVFEDHAEGFTLIQWRLP